MLMTSIFVVNGRIYRYQFKCNYLKNQIHFCAFLLYFTVFFIESTLHLKHFEKKLNLIPDVFLKLLTLKDVVSMMHKRPCFWKHFGSQSVKCLQKTNLPKTFLWHLRINVAEPICKRRKDLHQKKQRKRKVFYLNAIKQVKL